MAVEATTSILIGPSIAIGLLLGIIELIFLAKDEAGMHWLKHGLHAIPVMLVFTFIAMNIEWALSLVGITGNFWYDLGARVAIGLVAMIKIKAAASITGKGGVGESFIHTLIIGILVMASPYIWEYLLANMIGQYIPF
ncbi:hypothetical protein K9L97_06060 [Candidatus Woesearchaeota archaeon]|nr:hypothetical protein [Candidatus Woesearchaeota archaeon]